MKYNIKPFTAACFLSLVLSATAFSAQKVCAGENDDTAEPPYLQEQPPEDKANDAEPDIYAAGISYQAEGGNIYLSGYKNRIVVGADSTITKAELPDFVIKIDNNAFSGCTSLTEIVIPDSVEIIGSSAFSGCTSLTEIVIPDSVKIIGSSAFSHCINLKSVKLSNSITGINDYTFDFCTALKNIYIPESVTSIGKNAFRYCSSLDSISIPYSVTSIGDSAFSSCVKLTDISLPDNLASIGSFAFSSCNELPGLYISESVSLIGEQAFQNCDKLKIYTPEDSYAYSYLLNSGFESKIGNTTTTERTVEITTETTTEYVPSISADELIFGDANADGKLTAADAAVILQKVLNNAYKMPIEYITDNYLRWLDVNEDGELTAADSSTALQKVLNNGFTMPIEKTAAETVTETATETTTEAIIAHPSDEESEACTVKGALLDYSSGGGQNELNIGIIGPVRFLGNTANAFFRNNNGSSAGNVASRGSIVLNSSSENEGYQSIFSRQKVSFDHSMSIYGEIYCNEFDATGTSNHLHIYNTVYAAAALSIGGANSDFSALVSGGEMNIGGDGAVINGDVTSGGDLNIGLAAKYRPQTGRTIIYGDIFCSGNVLIKYQNASDIFISGSIYANGSVTIQDSYGKIIYSSDNFELNDKGIVGGQIYSTSGEKDKNDPRYTGMLYNGGTASGTDMLSGRFDNITADIEKRLDAELDAELPVTDVPITTLPADGAYKNRVYNSLEDITSEPYEKDGYIVYTITESGTINFAPDEALSKEVNGKYPAILIDTLSDSGNPKKIDLYFTSNFKLDDPYGNGSCGKIMVNDHDHSGLVRFFLASGIEVKLNCQSGSSGKFWLVLPLNNAGNIDWNYVPNLYVFSLETTTGKNIGLFGAQNGRPCFPGYWLTPNLSTYTASFSGFSGNDSTAVTEENCPRVHGMLAVQSASFRPAYETIIKFFDPDTAEGQKWSFEKAVSDVYRVSSSQ